MPEILTIASGYNRLQKKDHEKDQFRNPRNVGEMITYCESRGHIQFLALDGSWRQAKINGKVRTWKRDKGKGRSATKVRLS